MFEDSWPATRVGKKNYLRPTLPEWDAKWHTLSLDARKALLEKVKSPPKQSSMYRRTNTGQWSVPVEAIAPAVLDELMAAGFVELRTTEGKKPTKRIFALDGTAGFHRRIRALARYHLLDPDQPSEAETYFNANFRDSYVSRPLHDVLIQTGIQGYWETRELFHQFVLKPRWPGWVVAMLKDPVAEKLMSAVRRAEGPLLIVDLPDRVAGASPEKVRAALDALVAHLALVEDLDPANLDLRVGLLPAVRAALDRAERPRERPPLPVVAEPKELGPDESFVLSDLRALLLEVANEPPRLRQDGTLFQKEVDRFTDLCDPLPDWLIQELKLDTDSRIEKVWRQAHALGLVRPAVEENRVHLQLEPKGKKWLTATVDEQYSALIAPYLTRTRDEYLSLIPDELLDTFYYYNYSYSSYNLSDSNFLGVNVASRVKSPKKGGQKGPRGKQPEADDLRNALDRTFTAVPVGTFYRLDDFVNHSSFGRENPVTLGLDPEKGEVAIYRDGRPVPPFAEAAEETGRYLLDSFVRQRLIPLGCVRAAIDDQGRLCIAREPQLDAYFGRAVAPSPRAAAAAAATRVVVQPDFSIVIIGANPAPAAELIPFCERTSRGAGRGAIVLKMTRESVVKAVANGLAPAEVLARLKRHASQEVPANVLREVEGWTGWVRRVTPEILTVLRCPDPETADRVMAALRKQAERLQDTLVALSTAKLTAVERKKLQDQGLILAPPARPQPPKPPPGKKRRRR